MQYKVCRSCCFLQSTTAYCRDKHQRDGLNKRCRSCMKEDRAERQLSEEYRRMKKDDNLRRNYGITVDQFEKMLLNQKGLCCICYTPISGRQVQTDHKHGTGQVRGLLCHFCNRGLGFFRDSAVFLRKAAEYIECQN